MTSKSQKVARKVGKSVLRKILAIFLVFLLVLLHCPLTVLAGEIFKFEPQLLAGDILTEEIEQLAEVKPELAKNYKEVREEKIREAQDDADKWTERIVLGKMERGSAVEDVLGKRKDAEKVVADLKEAGVLSTLTDEITGEEKEINPNLVESDADEEILETTETPYETEISTESTQPLILAENSEAAGEIVSAKESDKQVAEDSTPDTQEEIRYFNWNANEVEGQQDENKILYRDLWDSTDLLVTAGDMGVKEDIILKNSLAPTEFNYIVETIGLELQTTDDGGFVFIDVNGEEKFYTPAPNITDAEGNFVENGIHYELGWRQFADSSEQLAEEEVEEVVVIDPVLAEVKFDENRGKKVSDEKSENEGKISGAKWFAEGVYGSALLFDGEDDIVEVSRDFEIGREMSLSTWVKSSRYQSAQILGIGRHSLHQDEQEGWKAMFRVGDKNLNVTWDTSTLYLERWYHLVATFDGERIRIFVNGEEKNYQSIEGSLTPNDEPILVGGGNGNFRGVIDEVQIFNEALSTEEVQNLHQGYLDKKAEEEKEVEVPEEEIEVVDVVDIEVPEEEIEVIEESDLEADEDSKDPLKALFEKLIEIGDQITLSDEAVGSEEGTAQPSPPATADFADNTDGADSADDVGAEGEEDSESTEPEEEESETTDSTDGTADDADVIVEDSENSEGEEEDDTEVQVGSATPEPAEATPEPAEATQESLDEEEIIQEPQTEEEVVEESPVDEEAAVVEESSTEEVTGDEVTGEGTEENTETSFFDLLKAFILPVANADDGEIEKFDETVSIEELVEEGDEEFPVAAPKGSLRDSQLSEEKDGEGSESGEQVIGSIDDVVVKSEEGLEVEEESDAEVQVDFATPEPAEGDEELPVASSQLLEEEDASEDNEEPEAGASETEHSQTEPTSAEAPAGELGNEDAAESSEVAAETEGSAEDDSSESEEISAEESESKSSSEDEVEVVEESEVEKFFAPEELEETPIKIVPIGAGQADEIEVIEESEVEKFFAPEEIVEEEIKIIEEAGKDLEIIILSEQEVFAQSNAIFEEIEESDGVVLRRYKLRLVIDVHESWYTAAEGADDPKIQVDVAKPKPKEDKKIEEETKPELNDVAEDETKKEEVETEEISEVPEDVAEEPEAGTDESDPLLELFEQGLEGSESSEGDEGGEGLEGEEEGDVEVQVDSATPEPAEVDSATPEPAEEGNEGSESSESLEGSESLESEEGGEGLEGLEGEEESDAEVQVDFATPEPAEESLDEEIIQEPQTEEGVVEDSETMEEPATNEAGGEEGETATESQHESAPEEESEIEIETNEEDAEEPEAEVEEVSLEIDSENLGASVLGMQSGESESVEVKNLSTSVLDAHKHEKVETAELKKTLILVSGVELTYPLDIDPTTFVALVNRGARTFAPNFSDGNQNGEYSQTNNPGVVNRGNENFIPQDGLVGYWPMSLNEAGQIRDYSGKDSHGTIQGGAAAVDSGKWGQATEFGGTDGYLEIGSTNQAVSSVSFWIHADNVSSDIIDFDGGTHTIEVASGTLTATGFDSPKIYIDGFEDTILPAANWYHVAITTETPFTASALRLGKATTFFNGKLDEFAIHNRLLTAFEIASMYHGGRVAAASSQITAVDSSGREFFGSAVSDSQDWAAVGDSLGSNEASSKIRYKTENTTEVWAGLTLSPAGGIIRATIDKGTNFEIVNEIDSFSESVQPEQKVLLATGLRNTAHTIELELLKKKNPRALSASEIVQLDDSQSSFRLDYLESHSTQYELAGRGIASTADSGDETTLVDSALTQGDDYWQGYALTFTSGDNNGETVFVTDFDADSDTLTFAPAVGSEISTETFQLTPDGVSVGERATRGIPATFAAAQDTEFEILGNLPTTAEITR